MRIGYWRDRRKGNEVSDADIRELKELHEMSFMALLMGGLILPPLAWIVYGIPPIHAPAPTSRRLHSLAASIWRNRTGDAARGDSPPGS